MSDLRALAEDETPPVDALREPRSGEQPPERAGYATLASTAVSRVTGSRGLPEHGLAPDRAACALPCVTGALLCPGCGELFTPKHWRQRHCGPSCRVQAYRRRRMDRSPEDSGQSFPGSD